MALSGKDKKKILRFLVLFLFFIGFQLTSNLQVTPVGGNLFTCPIEDSERVKDAVITTTRHQAVVNFVSALQLEEYEGGFVSHLTSSRASQDTLPSSQATMALSLVAGLSTIGTTALSDFVTACQLDNGAFSSCPWMTETGMAQVVNAIKTLHQINTLSVIDHDGVVNYLMSCYRASDGGFNSAPDNPSTVIWHTYWGIQCLDFLGELNRLNELTTEYVMSFYKEDSSLAGFSTSQTGSRNLASTFRGLTILSILGGLNLISPTKIVDYVMGLYNPTTGAFLTSLSETRAGVSSLDILESLDQLDSSRTTDYVLSCQSPLHGGFVETPGDSSNPTDERVSRCENAIIILEALDQLDVLQEEFTIQSSPAWNGDSTPPTTYTPTTSLPPLGPEFWAGVVLVAVAGSVFAVVVFYGLTRTGTRRKTVKKKTRRKHRRT